MFQGGTWRHTTNNGSLNNTLDSVDGSGGPDLSTTLATSPLHPSEEARANLKRPKSLLEKARMNVAWVALCSSQFGVFLAMFEYLLIYCCALQLHLNFSLSTWLFLSVPVLIYFYLHHFCPIICLTFCRFVHWYIKQFVYRCLSLFLCQTIAGEGLHECKLVFVCSYIHFSFTLCDTACVYFTFICLGVFYPFLYVSIALCLYVCSRYKFTFVCVIWLYSRVQ